MAPMTPMAPMAKMGVIFLTWRRHLQKQLVPHGITLKQVYLLRHLTRAEFVYPADAAEMLFCDRPTATVVIRNMERQGWVRRAPDPDNRKRVRVSITAAGRRKLASVPTLTPRAGFDPLGALSEKERGQLERLLGKVDGQLRQIAE